MNCSRARGGWPDAPIRARTEAPCVAKVTPGAIEVQGAGLAAGTVWGEYVGGQSQLREPIVRGGEATRRVSSLGRLGEQLDRLDP
jgi:hypothetical protein